MTSEYTHNDDIVTRLRLWATVNPDMVHVIEDLHKAADEIERLRAELIEAQDTIHGCELVIDNQKAIIDRNAWETNGK